MSTAKAKVIAVTGGSRGIGAAVVERVAAAGHDVLVGFHRDEDAANEVVDRVRSSGARAVGARVDVTDASSLEAFFRAGGSRWARSPEWWPPPVPCVPLAA